MDFFFFFLLQETCAIFSVDEKRDQMKEALSFLFDQTGCSVIGDV